MIKKQSVSNTLYIPLRGNIYASKNFLIITDFEERDREQLGAF